MRRTVMAGAAALAGVVLAAAAAARADCKLSRVADLPVVMIGARPTIAVKFNDKPARLEVDSGAFFSMISTAGASQLGLRTYPAPFNHVMGVNGEAQVSATRVPDFGLGGFRVPRIEFLVGGGSLDGRQGLVGVLGRNILAAADFEYDLAHGQISVFKPQGCGSKPLSYWTPTPGVLPMARKLNDRDTEASVFIKINGADIRAVLDTGAESSILTQGGARKAGMDVHAPGAVYAGATTGLGRRLAKSWIVPADSVKIDDEEIKHTKVRVSDIEVGGADMLLGADFFLSHRVYVANSQQRIYFTYNGGPVFDLSVKPNAAPPSEPLQIAVAPPPWAAPPGAGAGAPDAAPTAAGSAATAAPPPSPAADEPKDADGYSRRGQAYVARRDYARALADLSRAVELDPQNPRYLRERADLRLLTRQPFLAMADLDAVLKAAPDDAEAHLIRARLRASGRDRAGEVADLDAADKAAPPQADLRLTLGSLFTGLDQNDRAVAEFDQWLAVHRGDAREATALNGRCWARARAGRDLDQAQRDCDAAVRMQPRTAAFLDSRGLVELKRGDLARARGDYDAALALQPKFSLALYARGVVRRRQGDAAGADADTAAATALNAQVGDLARRAGIGAGG